MHNEDSKDARGARAAAPDAGSSTHFDRRFVIGALTLTATIGPLTAPAVAALPRTPANARIKIMQLVSSTLDDLAETRKLLTKPGSRVKVIAASASEQKTGANETLVRMRYVLGIRGY